MTTVASLEINSRCELTLFSMKSGSKFAVRLTRIGAQQVAEALLEYAGARSKSGTARKTKFGCEMVSEPDIDAIRKAANVRAAAFATLHMFRKKKG